MVQSALDQIATSLSFLQQDHGFRWEDQDNSELLGCSFVVLTSDDFRLRIVTDRGAASIDISAPCAGAEWFDLDLVGVLIRGGDVLESREPKELVSLLSQEYSRVRDLFCPERIESTREKLNLLERERAKKVFPKAFDER